VVQVAASLLDSRTFTGSVDCRRLIADNVISRERVIKSHAAAAVIRDQRRRHFGTNNRSFLSVYASSPRLWNQLPASLCQRLLDSSSPISMTGTFSSSSNSSQLSSSKRSYTPSLLTTDKRFPTNLSNCSLLFLLQDGLHGLI